MRTEDEDQSCEIIETGSAYSDMWVGCNEMAVPTLQIGSQCINKKLR